MKIIQRLVSKNKKRYVDHGVDLDLSYILENVIAMGFPSENIEAAYRNPMDEVVSFLNSKHKDRYMIYNLCQERDYDDKKFGSNVVQCFPFMDHNPPEFFLITKFCESVDQWLNKHPENVAVIHCKAGKGRTGTMIACYMLHMNYFQDYESCLQFYAEKRTFNQKGVTIPSQIRYVKYYQQYLQMIRNDVDILNDHQDSIIIHEIVIQHKPIHIKKPAFSISISDHQKVIYNSQEQCDFDSEERVVFAFSNPCQIFGDFRITIYFPGVLGKKKSCQIWMNTLFMVSDSVEFESLPVSKIPRRITNTPLVSATIDPESVCSSLPQPRTSVLHDSISPCSSIIQTHHSPGNEVFRERLVPRKASFSCPSLPQALNSSPEPIYKICFVRDQIDLLHKKHKKEFPENFSLQIYFKIKKMNRSELKAFASISSQETSEQTRSFENQALPNCKLSLSQDSPNLSARLSRKIDSQPFTVEANYDVQQNPT